MIDAFSMFPRNVLPNACTSIKSVKYKTGYFADILSDKHDTSNNPKLKPLWKFATAKIVTEI